MKEYLFGCSRAADSVVSGGAWPKFKVIRSLRYVLVTFKDEENVGAGVVTSLHSYILDAQVQLTL